ncbi:MAG: hypothetical protein JJT89_03540 [Nitriliruptoraceae bacterium]|nr:hypothetical protein [Nitriliruptoraceae bacterium]
METEHGDRRHHQERAPRDADEHAAAFERDRQINISRPSAVDPHGDRAWPFLFDLLLTLSVLPVAGVALLVSGNPLVAIAAAAAWLFAVLRWRRRREARHAATLAATRTPRACPSCDEATFAATCPACGTAITDPA